MNPRDILLETLEYFGLPKGYINGEGHWKDWAKKMLEDQKAASLRKPTKKQTKRVGKKGKKDEDKKEEMKPPSWFDLSPFVQSFTKFLQVGAEVRTVFRKEVEGNIKKVTMLFCHESGEMDHSRHIDLNEFGMILQQKQISIPAQMNDNMAAVLECFGDIQYDEKIEQRLPKEDPKAKKEMKKGDEPPKPIDVTLKLTSHREFMNALNQIKRYDQMISKNGYLKSTTLNNETKLIKEEEERKFEEKKRRRNRQASDNKWEQYCS